MKLLRHPENPILKPDSKLNWQSSAVFNPSVIFKDGIFHMLYRATGKEKPVQNINGWKKWRVSSIGYAQSKDGTKFKIQKKPLIKPEYAWEKMGCEDPRISQIGDIYYIFYTAVSTSNNFLKVRLALAETADFKKIIKHGPVGPDIPKDEGFIKAAAFFPEKINNQFKLIFTWHSDSPESTILLADFKNINELVNKSKKFWDNFLVEKQKHILITPTKKAYRGPEVGATPIRTKNGWLLIYCGESLKKEWTINAALLDFKNPQKINWQSKNPLLKPEKSYEKKGIINNVTFPESAVIVGNKLNVYYGAGDQFCCLATTKLN